MSKELIANPQQFIEENREAFADALSSDLDINNFIAAVTTMMAVNPDIIAKCSRDSIKKACIKAAYDGLRPDNKEAALVPFWNDKEKTLEAQYMPMVFGVRKKARQNDDIIITSEVVYKNDHFVVVKGDDDRIEHTPAPMDEEPGSMVAAYAIFKQGGAILHREVMRLSDIEKVRAAAKSEKSPAWKNWEGEMAKKAAVHRGAKSVPMSDATRRVIERDNDLYDLGMNAKDVTPKAVPLANRFGGRTSGGFDPDNVKQLDGAGSVSMDRIDGETGEIIEPARAQTSSSRSSTSQAKGDDQQGNQADRLPSSKFQEYGKALVRCVNADNLKPTHDAFWKGAAPASGPDYDLARAIYSVHSERLKNGSDATAAIAEVTKLIEREFPL